jgi:coronin-1B/1C/6
VCLLKFHPTADNVLASVSKDNEIKLWDVSTGSQILSNLESKDLIQDIVWDYTGKHYTTATKDKLVSIYDARTTTVAASVAAHEGSKGVKLTYLGDSGNFLSVGFTRQSQREFKIWDPRNLDTPVHKENIDTASGAIIPFYDEDTQILYLAGKGDGNIRYYEITPSTKPYQYPINSFKSNVPAKGMAWVPKRKLNIMKCETARLLKLTHNGMEPLSFTVPRKSECFQDDIFPDTNAGMASVTCAEWLEGADKPPVKMSLNPAKGGSTSLGAGSTSAPIAAPAPAPVVAAAAAAPGPETDEKAARPTSAPAAFTFTPTKSAAVLTGELASANARIKDLEARLAAAGIDAN